MAYGTGSDPGLTTWEARMSSLGLDPERDGVNIRILRHTGSLAEYKEWLAFPDNANAATNDVKPEKIATIPEGLVRRYVTEHVANERVLTNDETIAAIEKRVGRFYTYLMAAPDITITGDKPLIINSTGTVTIYNNVTIQDGGYIRITVPCKFECQTLNKIQGGTGTAYDVFVVGVDGFEDSAGYNPPQPPQAPNGQNAECDCCGGTVARNATNGAPGRPGESGGDAGSKNTAGQPGPQAYFYIAQSLTGTLSFLNAGGKGGDGANGGAGARGGQGGNGGNGTTCGAYHPDGATGGTGGKGGNGGNASNGKDGGAGGVLTINVPPDAARRILVTNGVATGGARGLRGFRGLGGQGGNAGSQGGTPGTSGPNGDSDGLDGVAGNPGAKGSSTVNGQPVGG